MLDRARGRASALGARTLATVGVESESELAFAGLHQLLAPIRSRIAGLPDPQREALDAAFGANDLVEPDPFRVALAAYRLISDAADSSSLLLIADDAHWLDRSSLDVLTFLARRLDNEPVVFMAALRDGFSTALEEAGLPILQLDRAVRIGFGEVARPRCVGTVPSTCTAACWLRLPAIRSGSWSLRGPYQRPATPSSC